MAGAPIRNQNAAKSRMMEQALIREIKQRDAKDGDGETMRKIAKVWIDRAMEGDMVAGKEVRDTLDGKPTQTVEGNMTLGLNDVFAIAEEIRRQRSS